MAGGREIMLFNSVLRKKTLLKNSFKSFSWYQCGPTVYDDAHIGHARTYVCMDVLKRFLKRKGFLVRQAINITDIDDKIMIKCKALGLENTPWILTRHYEDRFKKDMEQLNVQFPDIWLRVTDYIPQMVQYIERLIESGFAYVLEGGDVYFDIAAYDKAIKSCSKGIAKYGVFQACSSRIESPQKRNASDFALWKMIKDEKDLAFGYHTPWSSSSGCLGRPGWHLECSVMAQTIFGDKLDLHTGGEDLKFPHHENEIAQCRAANMSCCSSSKFQDWCSLFIHTGHITMGNDKMSKSLGNDVKISSYLREHGALHLRLLCLISRYSSPLDLRSGNHIDSVNVLQQKLEQTFSSLASIGIHHHDMDQETPWETSKSNPKEYSGLSDRLDAALCDDLNTAVVLGEDVPRLTSLIQSHFIESVQPPVRTEELLTAAREIFQICNLFGLTQLLSSKAQDQGKQDKSDTLMNILEDSRFEIRKLASSSDCPIAKKSLYRLSDKIRERTLPHLQISDRKIST